MGSITQLPASELEGSAEKTLTARCFRKRHASNSLIWASRCSSLLIQKPLLGCACECRCRPPNSRQLQRPRTGSTVSNADQKLMSIPIKGTSKDLINPCSSNKIFFPLQAVRAVGRGLFHCLQGSQDLVLPSGSAYYRVSELD